MRENLKSNEIENISALIIVSPDGLVPFGPLIYPGPLIEWLKPTAGNPHNPLST